MGKITRKAKKAVADSAALMCIVGTGHVRKSKKEENE